MSWVDSKISCKISKIVVKWFKLYINKGAKCLNLKNRVAQGRRGSEEATSVSNWLAKLTRRLR